MIRMVVCDAEGVILKSVQVGTVEAALKQPVAADALRYVTPDLGMIDDSRLHVVNQRFEAITPDSPEPPPPCVGEGLWLLEATDAES